MLDRVGRCENYEGTFINFMTVAHCKMYRQEYPSKQILQYKLYFTEIHSFALTYPSFFSEILIISDGKTATILFANITLSEFPG